MKLGWRQYLERFLSVKDRETYRIVPLVLWDLQREWLNEAGLNEWIVKSRRQGFSTAIGGEFFSEMQVEEGQGIEARVVAHKADSTKYLLDMVKTFYLELPRPMKDRIRVENFNTNEITFPDLHASYRIETAGSQDPGRATAIHRLHVSELAFWEDDAEAQFKGLAGCVPVSGKKRVESTANGRGNFFHKGYQDAKLGLSVYVARFYAWFRDKGYRLRADSPVALPKDRVSPLEYTAEETRLVLLHGLDEEQIRWRRAKVQEFGSLFPQEFPENDVDAFLPGGTCFFDRVSLMRISKMALDAVKVEREGTGDVRIWMMADPKERYAFGGDAAEGLEGGDRSAGYIYSLNTGQQAATLQGLWSPSEFARLVDKYGRMYNNAYTGVERDKSGALVLQYLDEIYKYPNLHYHPSATNLSEVKLGYPIGEFAKFTADNELNDAIKSNEFLIRDREVLGEMSSFVRHKSGKVEAAAGTHDDLVSAAKIAWQLRKYAPTRPVQTVENEANRYRVPARRGPPAFKTYLEKVDLY